MKAMMGRIVGILLANMIPSAHKNPRRRGWGIKLYLKIFIHCTLW